MQQGDIGGGLATQQAVDAVIADAKPVCRGLGGDLAAPGHVLDLRGGAQAAGKAGEAQPRNVQPGVEVGLTGAIDPLSVKAELRVPGLELLDIEAAALLHGARRQPGLARQRAIGPGIADAQVARGAGQIEDPALGAVGDPGGRIQRAADTAADEGQIRRSDLRRQVGLVGAIGAAGIGAKLRVVDPGGLKRDGAILERACRVEAGLAPQGALGPGLTQGQIGCGAGQGEGLRAGRVVPQRGLGHHGAGHAEADGGQIADRQIGAGIGAGGPDRAFGIDPGLVVGQAGALDRIGAVAFQRGNVDIGGARQGAGIAALAKGQILARAGDGQPPGAVAGIGEGGIHIQRPLQPQAQRGEVAHGQLAGGIGAPLADFALRGCGQLFIGDIGAVDADGAVPMLLGCDVDGGGAGQRRIGLRLPQPDVLAVTRQRDPPCPGGVGGQFGLGVQRPGPALPKGRKAGDLRRRLPAGTAIDQLARGLCVQLRVRQIEAFQPHRAIGRLLGQHGQVGLPAKRAIDILLTEREVLAGRIDADLPVTAAGLADRRIGGHGTFPARPHRRERGDVQPRIGLCPRRAERAGRGDRKLVIADARLAQRDHVAALSGLQVDPGLATQKPVDICLTDGQVAAGSGDPDIACGGIAGDLGPGVQKPRETLAQRAKIGDIQIEGRIDRAAGHLARAVQIQLRVPQLQRGQAEPVRAFLQLGIELGRTGEGAVDGGNAGLQVRSRAGDGQLPRARPANQPGIGIQRAGEVRVDIGQRRDLEIRREVQIGAVRAAARAQADALRIDGQIAQLGPVLGPASRQRDGGISLQQVVELCIVQFQIGAGHPALGIESAGQDLIIAGQFCPRPARQVAPGQFRKVGQVVMAGDDLGRGQHDPAGQAVEGQLPVKRVILARDLHPGQFQHLAGGEVEAGLPGNAVADDALDFLIGQFQSRGVEA